MFSIKSLVNDSVKMFLILILSYYFNATREVICYLIPFLSIRMFMGGIHKKTFLGCLLVSMVWIVIGVLFPRLYNVSIDAVELERIIKDSEMRIPEVLEKGAIFPDNETAIELEVENRQ